MSNTDTNVRTEILNTWLTPVQRDYAGWELHQIGKAWLTLALIQLTVSLYCHLLPGLPFNMSLLPAMHIYYAGPMLVFGLLFSFFKNKLIALVVGVVSLGAIGYESYSYVTDHMEWLAADLVYWQLAVAAVWRLLLLTLSLRSIRVALLLP